VRGRLRRQALARAASTVEYALLVAWVAVLVFIVVLALGPELAEVFSAVGIDLPVVEPWAPR
jgi:Flp pilus assembly pilin Flp